MHIVNKLSIAQTLIAGINILATLASYYMFFHLHLRNPFDEVLYLDSNEMQHMGQAILIYRMAKALFFILLFDLVVQDGDTIEHQQY